MTKTIDRRLEDLEARTKHEDDAPAIVYNDPELAAELRERGVEVVTFTVGNLDLENDI